MAFQIISRAFLHNEEIPGRYTCDGEDVSPPLSWTEPPAGTASLVLIMDDPDAPDPRAPQRTWVHWVLYNLPADLRGLADNAANQKLPPGARTGANDWKRPAYGGPCPPIGRHRYFFKLYALDTTLPELGVATKARVLEAMETHRLGCAELVGTYEKSG